MAPHRRVAVEHASKEECGSDDRPCSPPSPPLPSSASASAPSPSAVVVALAPSLPLPFPATPIQIDDKNHKLTMVVIIVASALAACFLLLTCFTVLRYRSSLRRRRRQAALLAAAFEGPPQPLPAADDDELRADVLVGAGGEDPYHVWYIRTVGLDEPTIGAISVCSYKRGEGLVEGTDCAVCLGEFADGELLRLLPKCSHAFHIPCIDTWLRSHVNCPLCRAPILAPSRPSPSPPFAADASATADVSAAVADQNDVVAASVVNSLGAQEEGSDEEAASASLPPPHFTVDHPSPGSSFSSEESEIWVPIDLGNGGLGDDATPVAPPEEPQGGAKLQPAPRSVSMDSSALGGLLLRMRLAGSSADGRRKPSAGEDPSTTKKMGAEEGCCKGPSLADGPLEMERSMSGERFFLSRFSGRPRSAILPL